MITSPFSIGTYRRHDDDLHAGLGGHTDVLWEKCYCFLYERLSIDETRWIKKDGSYMTDRFTAPSTAITVVGSDNVRLRSAQTIVISLASPLYPELLQHGWYSVFQFEGNQFGENGRYATMRRKD